MASWYGPGFIGRSTANGEIYDPSELTAAHKTLPFGSQVKVTNLNTGKSVVVRINDRGPFRAGRIIDLSPAAAERIDLLRSGLAPVKLELLTAGQASAQAVPTNTLKGFEVASPLYPIGQLLLLASDQSRSPVIVRVAYNHVPDTQSGVFFVSKELYQLLGRDVFIFID
jgi:rare lipoprotein A